MTPRAPHAPLLLTLLALLATVGPSAAQAPPPARRLTADPAPELGSTVAPDGAVAYSRLTSPGNWDIYFARNGATPVNLTEDSPVADAQPAYSPDGRSIAFRSERQGGGIFVMAAGGGIPRRVVAGAGWNPSWSPDGTQILYNLPDAGPTPYGTNGAANGLYIANAETGQARRILAAYAFEPQMSPDGSRVAYWALGGPPSGGVQRDIWTVRADGTAPARVTNDEAVDWSPVWSPDGRYLYFASDRDGAMKVWRVAIDQVTGQTSGSPELVTRDAGAQIRGDLSISVDGMLTYSDRNETRALFRVLIDAAGLPAAPALISPPTTAPNGAISSPDGAWVAFTPVSGQEDIFVMRSDGTDLRRLSNDVYRDRVPTWSPDSRRVAFRSDRPSGPNGARGYLWYQIDLDGTNLRPLAPLGATTLLWAPDGSRVAVYSAEAIAVVNADGSAPRLVGRDAMFSAPVWSSDGLRLAYREVRGPLFSIFTLDMAEGSAPVPVVRSTTTIGAPVLSPDGRRVAYAVPNEGTFVVDATQAGATPERLPAQPFTPVAWSADGKLLLGARPAGGNQAVAPLLYDFATGRFELLAESGAGAQWSADGSYVVVNNEGGAKLQLVDRATKTVRDLVSVTPPASISYGLSVGGRSVFYNVIDLQAHIYRIRVP